MLIFYDLETTGLNQFHDKITEVCLIKQTLLEVGEEKFSTLVNPEIPISDFITRLTGIDNSMVADKLTFNQISGQLTQFINKDIEENKPIYFIAHNNEGFDKLVLNSHFKRAGIDMKQFNWRFLDTLLIAKRLYPNFRKYNLKSLCENLGVPLLNAHRAEADTIMLKNLFNKMMIDLSAELQVSYEVLMENPQLIYDYTN